MTKTTGHLELLLVEDNPSDIFLLKQMLQDSPLQIQAIHEASRLEDARRIIGSQDVQLAIIDLSLPDSFGIDTYLGIKTSLKKIPVIILTGQSDAAMALQAIKEGAQDYLIKGEFNTHWLIKSIQYSMERMQNLEQIRESEEKYRQMFHRNPFPTIIVELPSLCILEVNDSAVKKYGYRRSEFAGMSLQDISKNKGMPVFFSLNAADQPGNKELQHHYNRSGDLMYMEICSYPIPYAGKTAIQMQMNDVTEKIQLEKELAGQQEAQQRQITAAVLEAQEKERVAIGEELHDNINQIIASVRLFIEIGLKKNEPEKTEFLRKAADFANQAIEENRKLSKILIVPQLKGEGLLASLAELRDLVMKSSFLEIDLEVQDFDESVFSDAEKISLYRIIQEQLNNILKHAKATHVLVRLYKKDEKIVLLIKDNGRGFDTSVRSRGVGLTNISSRAKVLKGVVEIHSAPGRGCEINIIMDSIR